MFTITQEELSAIIIALNNSITVHRKHLKTGNGIQSRVSSEQIDKAKTLLDRIETWLRNMASIRMTSLLTLHIHSLTPWSTLRRPLPSIGPRRPHTKPTTRASRWLVKLRNKQRQ